MEDRQRKKAVLAAAGAAGLAGVAVAGVLVGALATLDRWWPSESLSAFVIPAAAMFAIALASGVFREVLRRKGVGFPAQSREAFRLAGAPPAVEPGRRVLLHTTRERWARFAVGALALGPLLGGAGYFAATSPGHARTGAAMIAVAGALVLVALAGYVVSGRSDSQADAEGITWCSLFGGRIQRLPWDAVASCSVQTERDLLGRAAKELYTFYDDAGRELLRLDLAMAPKAEREQFLAMVRRRHGVPSELIAGRPPAGRGTEPEAAAPPGEVNGEMGK